MEFKRTIYGSLQNDLNSKKITILFGARQVGKSYLLKKLEKENKKKRKSKYFNLEKPEDLALFNKSDAEIIQILEESGDLIFIDEFHYVKNASHIFKAIYDTNPSIKIYASGSSAIEMHKHIKESLVGRFKEYQIKPLNYEEFLSNSTNLKLNDYLCYGALPGLYDQEECPKNSDKEEYLRLIVATYIQKDIKSLIKEENISAFNHLIFILAEFQGQIVVTSNLANDLNVSSKTVEKYLSILEQTFVIYKLNSFSNNLSNELKKSKKYYFYDQGIRNALIKDFRKVNSRIDKGCIWETFVYHHLLAVREAANTDIFFWRTTKGSEIDFIWFCNREITAIEVKSKLKKPAIPDNMKEFLRKYPHTKELIVFNENINEETEYKGYPLRFISFDNILEF